MMDAHEVSANAGIYVTHFDIEDGSFIKCTETYECDDELLLFMQKLLAEFAGTYLLLFVGLAAEVVNKQMDDIITYPGVAILWGIDVMVMIYSVGHLSGAHFNPAVTIAFATTKRFAWKHVIPYILVQVMAATLATGTVQIMFEMDEDYFLGTLPSGSNLQSLLLEFIITFYLMFAVFGCTTDDLSIRELGGIALGATVTMNALFAGPISGASMNPARSLGPAIVCNYYKGIWIYIVGPIIGAVAGAWFYNICRLIKPIGQFTKFQPFKTTSAHAMTKDDEPYKLDVTFATSSNMSLHDYMLNV